jgi:hypothetical protein
MAHSRASLESVTNLTLRKSEDAGSSAAQPGQVDRFEIDLRHGDFVVRQSDQAWLTAAVGGHESAIVSTDRLLAKDDALF